MHQECSTPDFEAIVAGLKRGNSQAFADLYYAFERGLIYFFKRRLAADADDAMDLVHDTVFDTYLAVKDGKLVDPKCLGGYIHTIARRKLAAEIARRIQCRCRGEEIYGDREGACRPVELPFVDRQPTPEQRVLLSERSKIMLEALQQLKPLEQEILRRFYLESQTIDEIRAAMDLTPTQFRLNKTRAKAKLADAVKEHGKRDALKKLAA